MMESSVDHDPAYPGLLGNDPRAIAGVGASKGVGAGMGAGAGGDTLQTFMGT